MLDVAYDCDLRNLLYAITLASNVPTMPAGLRRARLLFELCALASPCEYVYQDATRRLKMQLTALKFLPCKADRLAQGE